PTAQPGPPTSSYDPYASTAPNGTATPPPHKKKSYWWVWLLVAGGGALLIGVIVAVAVLYAESTPTFTQADRAMLLSPRDPANTSRRTPATLLPLFHF